MRAGAGYVTACVPASLNLVFEARLLEVMTRRRCPTRWRARARCRRRGPRARWARASALVLGPGLGRADDALELARASWRPRAEVPLLLDADGLNAHAGRLEALAGRAGADRAHPARRRARAPARDARAPSRRAPAGCVREAAARAAGGRRAQGRRHARRRARRAASRSAAAAPRRWPPPAPATSCPGCAARFWPSASTRSPRRARRCSSTPRAGRLAGRRDRQRGRDRLAMSSALPRLARPTGDVARLSAIDTVADIMQTGTSSRCTPRTTSRSCCG